MKHKILSVLGVLMAVLMALTALAACEKTPAGADSSGGSGESVSAEQGGEPSVSEQSQNEAGAQSKSSDESDALTNGTPPETVLLTVDVAENADGEAEFLFSADDFEKSFDSVYRQSHDKNFFEPENCSDYIDTTPCFGYSARRLRFSAGENAGSAPSVSIYTANDGSVYEIILTFDDHGYSESLYKNYEEICRCALKTLLPGLPDEEICEIYQEVYAAAWNCFIGECFAAYDENRPETSAFFTVGKAGLYAYYGKGTLNIGAVPITKKALDSIKSAKINIKKYVIDDDK